MKTILTVAIGIALFSCSTPREFQAEMVKAELVKIDTVFRYADPPKQHGAMIIVSTTSLMLHE